MYFRRAFRASAAAIIAATALTATPAAQAEQFRHWFGYNAHRRVGKGSLFDPQRPQFWDPTYDAAYCVAARTET